MALFFCGLPCPSPCQTIAQIFLLLQLFRPLLLPESFSPHRGHQTFWCKCSLNRLRVTGLLHTAVCRDTNSPTLSIGHSLAFSPPVRHAHKIKRIIFHCHLQAETAHCSNNTCRGSHHCPAKFTLHRPSTGHGHSVEPLCKLYRPLRLGASLQKACRRTTSSYFLHCFYFCIRGDSALLPAYNTQAQPWQKLQHLCAGVPIACNACLSSRDSTWCVGRLLHAYLS